MLAPQLVVLGLLGSWSAWVPLGIVAAFVGVQLVLMRRFLAR
jgi:hypothetical protein